MTRPGYAQLQDVILDPDFPDLDLALRRGCHVDRDDVAWYALLGDAQDHLEAFYRRYGCELVHKPDGYFYLLPTGDKLSRRQLATGDMLVGQALALLYLHPSTIERGGLHTTEELIAQLAAVMGTDALIRAFNPKRRRYDERVAQKNVRTRVSEAVRRLAGLGFVEMLDAEQLRLRPALLRFAEPVRGLSEPAEALAQLVARGEIALEDEGAADAGTAADDEGEDDPDGDEEDGATDDAEVGEPAPGGGRDADQAVVRRVVHGDETAPANPGTVVRRIARDDGDVDKKPSETAPAKPGAVVRRGGRRIGDREAGQAAVSGDDAATTKRSAAVRADRHGEDDGNAVMMGGEAAAKLGAVVPRIEHNDGAAGDGPAVSRSGEPASAKSTAVVQRIDGDDGAAGDGPAVSSSGELASATSTAVVQRIDGDVDAAGDRPAVRSSGEAATAMPAVAVERIGHDDGAAPASSRSGEAASPQSAAVVQRSDRDDDAAGDGPTVRSSGEPAAEKPVAVVQRIDRDDDDDLPEDDGAHRGAVAVQRLDRDDDDDLPEDQDEHAVEPSGEVTPATGGGVLRRIDLDDDDDGDAT